MCSHILPYGLSSDGGHIGLTLQQHVQIQRHAQFLDHGLERNVIGGGQPGGHAKGDGVFEHIEGEFGAHGDGDKSLESDLLAALSGAGDVGKGGA